MAHAIGMLCACSFTVKWDDKDQYDIHRLAHLASRIRIDQQSHMAAVTEKAIQHVAEVFPSDDYANRAA